MYCNTTEIITNVDYFNNTICMLLREKTKNHRKKDKDKKKAEA